MKLNTYKLTSLVSRDRMVVGFTTCCAISGYHHKYCEFESRWWRDVHDTTLCDKVYQSLPTDKLYIWCIMLNLRRPLQT